MTSAEGADEAALERSYDTWLPLAVDTGEVLLKEANGGNVANNPKLRPVGDAAAKGWGDRGSSEKQAEGQRERRIRDAISAAFLVRFGGTS